MMKADRGSGTFPHFSDQYKCCCGAVHVLQGAQMVGIVSAIMIVISVFHDIFSSESAGAHILEYLLVAVEIITLIFLFIGIKKLRSLYILPFILYCLISLIGTLALMIVCTIAIVNPDSKFGKYLQHFVDMSEHEEFQKNITMTNKNFDPQTLRITAVFIDTAVLIASIVTAWFAWVAYKCYRYLKDLEQHRVRHTSVTFNVEAATVH